MKNIEISPRHHQNGSLESNLYRIQESVWTGITHLHSNRAQLYAETIGGLAVERYEILDRGERGASCDEVAIAFRISNAVMFDKVYIAHCTKQHSIKVPR